MRLRRVLIVEGGWQRGTLTAARCLGRAGHWVGVAGAERGHAARSRYTAQWSPLPDVASPALVDAVAELVRRHSYDVVFAGDDEHLLALSQGREALAPAVFPYAPHDTVLRALDKVRLYDAARGCGLPVPETRVAPPPAGDGEWIVKERLYLPGSSHEHLSHADDADLAGRDVVHQRVIPGRLLAVVAFAAPGGELLYAAAQRADAVHPEPFGVSSRARVVPLVPALRAQVAALLRELGWWGLAELQFVEDAAGTAHLIDLNGRFFGSLALTAGAGVDLPSAWVATAFGEPPRVGEVRAGARYQWLEGDLRRAAAATRPLPEVLTALRSAPGAAHSVFASDDPRPALAFASLLGRRAVRRAVRR